MMCPLIADEKKDAEAQTRRERSQALAAGRAGGERERARGMWKPLAGMLRRNVFSWLFEVLPVCLLVLQSSGESSGPRPDPNSTHASIRPCPQADA